ncbi:hypothetical protein THZG08_160107 [Vibrio owensii]|uniref:hypothetical protein n=1 Tax=Vibrio owensii TaxID=696485 RepID=UPI0028956174|nr:hypothetical protein THZG08_160107 [Vibrio owensii]CAH1553725.1 hypothetical protein THOA03_160108 [Vibrio owensii]
MSIKTKIDSFLDQGNVDKDKKNAFTNAVLASHATFVNDLIGNYGEVFSLVDPLLSYDQGEIADGIKCNIADAKKFDYQCTFLHEKSFDVSGILDALKSTISILYKEETEQQVTDKDIGSMLGTLDSVLKSMLPSDSESNQERVSSSIIKLGDVEYEIVIGFIFDNMEDAGWFKHDKYNFFESIVAIYTVAQRTELKKQSHKSKETSTV